LRDLARQDKLAGHRLIGSYRTARDIILRDEFEAMPGLKCLWTVTDEPAATDVLHARINDAFLREAVLDYSQNFYLCGPDPMIKELRQTLEGLGAKTDAVTWEK